MNHRGPVIPAHGGGVGVVWGVMGGEGIGMVLRRDCGRNCVHLTQFSFYGSMYLLVVDGDGNKREKGG